MCDEINYDIVTGFPHRADFMKSFDIYKYNHKKVFAMLLCINTIESLCCKANYSYNNKILYLLSKRLKEINTEALVICRYSYNEFLILTKHLNSYVELYDYLNTLIKKCTSPITIMDNTFNINVNVGISLFPDHSHHLVDLVYKADLALNRAKLKGANQFHLFTLDSIVHAPRVHKIHIGLQTALSNDEVYVVFQPKISAKSGNIIGFEALARWRHPTLGDIPPFEFISVAESTGMILPIGLFVFEQSCKRCKELIKLGYNDLKFSINLSKIQIQYSFIVDEFMSLLYKYNLDPSYIELEITENIIAFVLDKDIDTLQKFKELGFSIALDDFGTGSASFQYLKSLPVDTLKIDKSFISDIGINPKVNYIIQCLISMSHQLEMVVVAEGVETLSHVNFLKSLTCDIFQGYFYSKPITFDEIIPLLA